MIATVKMIPAGSAEVRLAVRSGLPTKGISPSRNHRSEGLRSWRTRPAPRAGRVALRRPRGPFAVFGVATWRSSNRDSFGHRGMQPQKEGHRSQPSHWRPRHHTITRCEHRSSKGRIVTILSSGWIRGFGERSPHAGEPFAPMKTVAEKWLLVGVFYA